MAGASKAEVEAARRMRYTDHPPSLAGYDGARRLFLGSSPGASLADGAGSALGRSVIQGGRPVGGWRTGGGL